jgi:hypothetical protein
MKYTITSLFLILGILSFAQSITVDDLKKHVSYLASDELKGREPGTEGDKAAADYIRGEFKNNGLQLLGEDGFQYFDIVNGIKALDNNHLYIDKFSCKVFEDNVPFPFSGNGDVTASAVFAGYGIEADNDKLKRNDYEGIDVKGKWVLILRGNPEPENKMSAFGPFSSDLSKVMTAIKKGAAGVLLVSGESFDKEDKLTELKFGRGNAQSEIPVIHIKRALADKVLGKGKSIVALEKELIETKAVKSFGMKTKIRGVVSIEYTKFRTQNVIGMIPGNNKTLASQYIVVGAHFDHLGMGGKNSGSRMTDTLAVHNGADDNASGVASMLEIAQRFKDENIRPDRSIVFIAFGAEEKGLLGSAWFVNHPLVDLKKVYAMLNLDMVGRLNEQKILTVSGTGTATEFDTLISALKAKTDMQLVLSPGGYGASDHSSFYVNNIPVLFFNSGAHQDYHTPFDDTELINFDGQLKITEFVFAFLSELTGKSELLTYQSTGNPNDTNQGNRTFKVTLGIMPGIGDVENKGLRVDGTRKDGPAEVGGIKRGDVITAINGEKIANINEYMELLNKLEVGQRIMVDINRSGEKMIVTIQL